MNSLRARLFSSALFVFLVLAAAAPSAMAQKAHAVWVHHQMIPAGKTCSSCHGKTYGEWKASPHGAAGVQCTVCHGEITAESVAATPSLSVCKTCHAQQVAQLKSDSFMKGKTCVSCHQPHTFLGHPKAAQ